MGVRAIPGEVVVRSRFLKKGREWNIQAICAPRLALESIDSKFLAGGLAVISPLLANPTQALARCGMI
jgi:hypothetical protein